MADPPKAIGSLAKRQTELTRQGAQKLRFVPTLPARKKKEEIKPEQPLSSTSKADSGRGRDGIGRGKDRAAARKSMDMTASGPFSMGPALSGVHPSLTSPAVPPGPTAKAVLIPDVTPLSKKAEMMHRSRYSDSDEEYELFSEHEGVDMIGLHAVRKLDWMAPDGLRRSRKAERYVKNDECKIGQDVGNKGPLGKEDQLGAIIESYFNTGENAESRERFLCSFQFPVPFPSFSLTSSEHVAPSVTNPKRNMSSAKAAFPHDAKPELSANLSSNATAGTEQRRGEYRMREAIDGVVGRLEVYRSGIVRLRLGDGILLDVKSAAQLTFPQQVVVLEREDRKMIVLGEVDRRYLASPDVEALLVAAGSTLKTPAHAYEGEDELVVMT